MGNSLRVVVDTNVLVSRLLAPDSVPARVVSHAVRHGRLLVSEATLAELAEVLGRQKFDRYLTLDERKQFVRLLVRFAEIPPIAHRVAVCRDPADNKFLDLALSGAASAVVTGDRDLLELHPFQRIPIMKPADYLDWASQVAAP